MTETIFKKHFSKAHNRSTNMDEAGFMTYASAKHQVAMKTFWLHFWEAAMSFIFKYMNQPGHVWENK